MDAIVEKLDEKLREWEAATADEVRRRVIELIELADENALVTHLAGPQDTAAIEAAFESLKAGAAQLPAEGLSR